MYRDRIELYKKIEREYNSKILVYVTSDRTNMSAQIAQDAIDLFIRHLEKIRNCDRLSLFLYTRGGDTAAAWNIVNLLKMYCDELQVIVPHKAHSAGTIICLGANEIIMTKQATLSPIDPSITTPLNPSLKNSGELIPISVEAVKGYLEFAKKELEIKEDDALAKIYIKLSESIHPLVIGEAYRSKDQIKMIAGKLLSQQIKNEEDVNQIINFLCSDSGGHDYTINRREAENDLKLPVKKPSEKQYKLIKSIYDDISQELLFEEPFNPMMVNGSYAGRRSILESLSGGSDYFITEGSITKIKDNVGQNIISDSIAFQGWRHENYIDDSIVEIKINEEGTKYESSEEFQM